MNDQLVWKMLKRPKEKKHMRKIMRMISTRNPNYI